MTEPTYSPMQTVKRRFFAMRNGIIADTLRKAGSPFRIIFGLNLPQIVDIASGIGTDSVLAEKLWANSTTRESMLLAPMIADRESFSESDALRWIEAVKTAEVADILCHRLLRHLPFAWDLALKLVDDNSECKIYTGMRLVRNLLYSDPERAKSLALTHRSAPLAEQIIEEADFVLGNSDD